MEALKGAMRRALELSYLKLHVVYMVLTTLLASGVLVAFEGGKLGWVDAWFTSTSAMTVTGLGVVDFPALGIPAKAIVWALICLGGQVSFALVPLVVRKAQAAIAGGACASSCSCCSLSRARAKETAEAGAQEPHPNQPAQAQVALELECVSLLAAVYLLYGVCCTLAGFVALAAYTAVSDSAQAVLHEQGVGPVQFAAFTAVSAFNNAGFSVFSSSLVPFHQDAFVVLLVCALITAGNTLLPVLVRGLLLLLQHTCVGRRHSAAFKAVLETPRAFTTHLFDRQYSSFLLGFWMLVTTFQFILYTCMPYQAKLDGPPGVKALDMFSTTISTRTAGFNVLDLSALNPGILVLQVVLMYLSSYPFIVSMKTTTRARVPSSAAAAGQVGEGDAGDLEASSKRSTSSSHVRVGGAASDRIKQVLSQDAAWLVAGIWFIALSDSSLTLEQLFRLIWEVISAYGNVGLSLSTAADIGSFSSSLPPVGKLVIVAVMLVGRHRGMPLHLDAATEHMAPAPRPAARQRVLLHSLPAGQRHHTIGHAGERAARPRPAGVQGLFLA